MGLSKISKSFESRQSRMCCCGVNKNIFCLLSGVVFCMMSLVSVSTLSYPLSTVLVVFSSLDLMANVTYVCAHVSTDMKVTRAALFLTFIVMIKSLTLFGSSLFVSLKYMKLFLNNFFVDTSTLSPEIMRMIIVVSGFLLVCKSSFVFVNCYFLNRKVKQRGDVILWSYNEQGL